MRQSLNGALCDSRRTACPQSDWLELQHVACFIYLLWSPVFLAGLVLVPQAPVCRPPRRAGRDVQSLVWERSNMKTLQAVQSILQVCIGPSGCHIEKPNCTVTINPVRIDCLILGDGGLAS